MSALELTAASLLMLNIAEQIHFLYLESDCYLLELPDPYVIILSIITVISRLNIS